MKRILGLIIIGIAVFLIAKGSTFGWNVFARGSSCAPRDNLLVSRLKDHVYTLSYKIGDRNMFNFVNLNKAANYITDKFKSYGYKVEFQEYACQTKKVKNIIAVKTGSKFPEEVIIVGAHYDTYFNPGADDNASGIAGLLELASFMSGKENERTLKFIAFVNEEPPYFKTEHMGSLVYATKVKTTQEKIKAAIILEMLGYYTNKVFSQRYPPFFGFLRSWKGNFIAMAANLSSRKLLEQAVSAFKKGSKFPLEYVVASESVSGITFSDHWSFWQAGYPAILVTDTAFLRNRNYHLYTDTWEKLNYVNMASVVEGLYSVAESIVND